MNNKMNKTVNLLDCTLRDGGYYNDWDYSLSLIEDYLQAMKALGTDFVELGFRSLNNQAFKGGCAFSTDSFLRSLQVPAELEDRIGVMVNGGELINHSSGLVGALEKLFTAAEESPVSLVRIACHVKDFESCLPAASWLKDKGYLVGFNLMQIADQEPESIRSLAQQASQYPIDVLYFADSMGSLDPEHTTQIVKAIQDKYSGAVGIHAHDNMGQALANSMRAVEEGVTWVDSTVTGMGRGPGNVKTESLAIELAPYRKEPGNLTKILELVRKHFKPMQTTYGWGANPYYHLAGKYGIHPSYIQEMLSDSRYSEEDILSAIDHLKQEGGKRFSLGTLEASRHFYAGQPRGSWKPGSTLSGKDVLILGSGPTVGQHHDAIETFIKANNPFVIALNAQKNIDEKLIDIRAACHPTRLLADCHEHLNLGQPLATPASMLPEDVRDEFKSKELLDFGIGIKDGIFEFNDEYCILPTSLVMAYALAIATSGQAKNIYLAGFDGYSADDPRRKEADEVFHCYQATPGALPLLSVTPTLYEIPSASIYALNS